MAVLVALLRGINLAGRRRIRMAELRELLSDLGHANVRTLLQSGNAVFASDRAPGAAREELEAALEQRFGFHVDVVLRTAGDLAAVVAADPLGDVADDPKRYLVAFLGGEPDADAVADLRARDLGSERVAIRGRELYFWCPGGVHDSVAMKATAGNRLGATATVRNWATVTKLAALAAGD